MKTYLSALLASLLIFVPITTFADTQPIDDSVITTKIKSKILLDPSLSVLKVNVSANNGVVMLSGDVNSDSDAAAAVELAQSTEGVTDVNASELHIKNSNRPFADTAITAKVKGLFIKEKLFSNNDISAMTIKVETNNGIVYLSGTAEDSMQVKNAINIAKSVSGVKNVESRIELPSKNE